MIQAGSFNVSVPPNDATWGQVMQLVAAHQQKELDAFCKGGQMIDLDGLATVCALGCALNFDALQVHSSSSSTEAFR